MGSLWATVGCARSGKSTYCKEWVLEKPGRVRVCADDIRLALGDRFNSHVEGFVSAIKHTMIKTLLLSGFDIIVDGTHTSIGSIKQILQIDKNAQFIFFDTHPQTCKERAKATNQEDLYPVIDRMYDQIMELRGLDCPRWDIQEAINKLREKVVENRIQQ